METLLYSKVVYYEDSDFRFEVETYDRACLLHCEVSKWAPSVLKQMYRVLKKFLAECKDSGVIKVYTVTPNPKYAEVMGGRYTSSITVGGVNYEVYKWDLN